MALQPINLGTTANDGTGDDQRTAGQKINDNFTELYAAEALNTAKRSYPSGDENKLATIEDNAKDDQTGSEIRTLLAAEPDTNILTDAMVANIRTVEQFQDLVAAMLQGGTHTNMTVTYDDAGGVIDLASTAGGGGGAPLTQEQVEDFVAGVSTAGTGISVTYDDAANTLTFALTGEVYTTADRNKVAGINELADPAQDSLLWFDVSGSTTAYVGTITGGSFADGTLTIDVQSVAGLTGAITPEQLRTALNVADGAQVNTITSVVGQTGAVTSGQISTALGLGSAAGSDISAFATAAQGDVAETDVVTICLFDASEDVATGDKAGDQVFRVPAKLNGYNLTGVAAYVDGAGTTGATTVQVHNITQAADMLTALASIASGATDSTGATIDAANDDVATGDKIRIDVDAVSTTAPTGLWVELTFEAP